MIIIRCQSWTRRRMVCDDSSRGNYKFVVWPDCRLITHSKSV
jgi:hypothetical protein